MLGCISPLGFSERAQGARPFAHPRTHSLGRLRGHRRRLAAQPAYEHPHEASRRSTKRRDDVKVELNGYGHPFKGVTTDLSVGLGNGGEHADMLLFGPELQFGNVVGNHIKKQVLLLKYAVGGSTLYKSWRPPSAVTKRPLGPQVCGTNCGGNECMPDFAEEFKPENKADACCDFCCVPCSEAKCIQNGTCTCGNSNKGLLSKHSCGETNITGYTTAEGLRAGRVYVDMVRTIKNRLKEIKTKGNDYHIAGFAWFQGWSDATSKPDWVEHECN